MGITIKTQAANGLSNGDYKKWSLIQVASSKAIEFLSVPGRLKIGHCSFEQFAVLVHDLCNRAQPESVEYRLYRGLLAELQERMKQQGISGPHSVVRPSQAEP
jgi:hypothetical protein